MIKSFVLPVLWAALSSLGFGMIFGLRTKKLLYVALGSALTWLAYLICMELNTYEVSAYAIAAGIGTVYSEIMARVIKTPVTAFVIPVNIPLVPGASLFHSLLGLMQRDNARFLERGKYCLAAACAMALGIFIATMLFKLVKSVADRPKKR
ncbi:MAG: threonine/serine exporter family protein [Clostridia bacterium]|nr:threonine/serine exporter family protein [Clostridia bacterium]